MPNPLTLTDASDLIDLSIQDIWVKGSEQETRQFEQFVNVETGITDYYVKDSSLTGLGLAGRIVDNAVVTAASPVQGLDKSFTQVQFGVLLSFTKSLWYFGIQKRNLEQIVQESIKAVSDKREQLCADLLDNSFSTTYTVQDISGNYTATVTGGDGLAFISASHTREDGGTAWNNRVTDGSTVNMDFEYDALKAAHRTAALQVGGTGKPLNVSLDTFVCSRGYAVHNRAVEILGAINRGFIAASADRDGNASQPFKIVASPWITTNVLYWWMFDSRFKSRRYGFQYKEAQPITLEGPNKVFKTGEIQYKATTYFVVGHNDARGWVGSTNKNQA